MAALSWEEICEKSRQNNKEVICELEKRKGVRYFLIRCLICGFENESKMSHISSCKKCSFK